MEETPPNKIRADWEQGEGNSPIPHSCESGPCGWSVHPTAWNSDSQVSQLCSTWAAMEGKNDTSITGPSHTRDIWTPKNLFENIEEPITLGSLEDFTRCSFLQTKQMRQVSSKEFNVAYWQVFWRDRKLLLIAIWISLAFSFIYFLVEWYWELGFVLFTILSIVSSSRSNF